MTRMRRAGATTTAPALPAVPSAGVPVAHGR